LLTSYASTLRLVEGLSHEFGFRPVYVWQPTLHATNKQLSSREAEFLERIKSTESGRRMLRAHREAATVIDSQVRDVAGSRFVNLSRLFDSETRPIFADQVGHTYETANEAIVAAMMPALDNALSAGGAAGLCKEL
jgi:hypothetical protein